MVLITGASGLVGSHVAIYLLENGENVRAIFRDSKSKEKTKSIFNLHNKSHLYSKIDWIQGDILDIPSLELAFENIDYVYHCAAMISFDPKDEEKLRKTNIEGTANIVNFCLSKNVKKLCYVSSIAALGDLLPHETIITEETEWNPEKTHSDYAISKYGAEIEVFRAQQEGLNVVIVNPGVILGAGFFDSGSGEIFTKVKKGLKFYTNGTTGFVAVSDVVKIMFQLMKSDIQGERFILVSENVTYKNLLQTIATEFGVKKPSIQVTKWITILAYKLDWIMSNVFLQKRKLSKDMAQSLHSLDLYSKQKIVQTLDFDFEKVSTTIKKTIELQN
jgi:dihydroflavonol-4-reductase